MKLWILILLYFLPKIGVGQTKYQKDFKEFWTNIHDNYAYLKQQNINWEKVQELYQPQVDKVSSDNEFVRLLENVLNELYNGYSLWILHLESFQRWVPY